MEELRGRNWHILDSGYCLEKKEGKKDVELDLKNLELFDDLLIKRKITINKEKIYISLILFVGTWVSDIFYTFL